MFHKLIIGASILLASTLLYSQSLTIQGIWNGGGKEVYTKGNEAYCFTPTAGSTATFILRPTNTIIRSCIYLTLGDVVGKNCWKKPKLSLSNLSNKNYKIVVAPFVSAVNEPFKLSGTFIGNFGRCTDYYQAGYLGMSIESLNFILALSGMFTAIGFFGAITYTLMTLGNF